MMHPNRHFFRFFLATALTLTSCSPPLAQTAQVPSPVLAATSPTPAGPQPSPTKPSPTKPSKAKTVTVKAYKLNDRCTQQLAESVTVPAQQPIQATIAKVIKTGTNSDFSLAGFRVNVKSGVATVDLRVPSGAKRQLQSLSACERMALLGSIRKTLVSNAQWKIKTVKFTDRGKALVL